MALNLPPCPASLRSIQHFLKIATEHDSRDVVVAYWARLTALQKGLEIDKSSPEALAILLPLMEWLESQKKVHKENDAVVNEVVASAHIENYAMKLFLYADKSDRAGNFTKSVVKSFYSAGILFDVMQCFGEVTPEVAHYRKYAKMKAAYIHNCLKNGETPIAGPLTGEDDEEPEESSGGGEDQSQDQGFAGGFVPAAQPPAPAAPPASAARPPPQEDLGGFQPAAPAPTAATPGGAASLSIDQIGRVQKLCKYAISALDYQDTPTAIENLSKALHMCQTGEEPV